MAGIKTVRARIYLGADGPNPVIQAQMTDEGGQAIDDPFAGVDYMTLAIPDQNLSIDSRAEGGLMDWSKGGGYVELALGQLNIPAGEYAATLKAHDQMHPLGQVVAHAVQSPRLLLEFV